MSSTLHVGGCPPASETRIGWLDLTCTGSQQRPAWMNEKRRHALVRPPHGVPDPAADQGTPETIAEVFAELQFEPRSPQRGQPEARMGALSPLTETSRTSIHRPALHIVPHSSHSGCSCA